MSELEKIDYQVIPRTEFDNIYPWKGIKRCILRDNGTVNYYLDANDSRKKEDGTVSNLTGADGQVMVEIPKFWWKWEVGTIDGKRTFRWYISDTQEVGYTVHPAFFRDRNNDGNAEEVDFRYYSAYMGSEVNGKLSSITGKYPSVNKNLSSFRNISQSRGFGWGLVDYNLINAVQLLYLLEYGNFNSQVEIGRGYVDGNSSTSITGTTNLYGNNSYGSTSGKTQMSYRGIEDLWGNVQYWIEGIFSDSNRSILIGNKGFNDNGNGYSDTGVAMNSNVSGYIEDIVDNPNSGFIIKKGGTLQNSYLTDYGYLYSSRNASMGGNSTSSDNAGAFSISINLNSLYYSQSLGARITY